MARKARIIHSFDRRSIEKFTNRSLRHFHTQLDKDQDKKIRFLKLEELEEKPKYPHVINRDAKCQLGA